MSLLSKRIGNFTREPVKVACLTQSLIWYIIAKHDYPWLAEPFVISVWLYNWIYSEVPQIVLQKVLIIRGKIIQLTVQYRNIFGQVVPKIFWYCTVNCKITFVLYIQLFKENATFKLHFVLIVLPCKKQNVTYIRYLNYKHLPLKRTSSYKHTHTVN